MSGLTPVEDISYVNKRARQQSVVEMLDGLRDQADNGDVVGAVVVYVDNEGIWHHKRDMFQQDIPTMLGYLFLVLQKLSQRWLRKLPDDEDN